MDELVKSVLSELELRYTVSIILNMASLTGAIIMLYLVLKSFINNHILRKALQSTIVVIGLVILVILLQSILDFSYVIQTLKTVYETLTYETGQKSV
jgi:cobalamin biosynthesis protein CobD/CbiB